MSTTKTLVKGQDFILFDENKKEIGFCTNTSLSLSSNTNDIQHKDLGDVIGKEIVSTTWQVTATSFYVANGTDTTWSGYEYLLKQWQDKKQFTIYLGIPGNMYKDATTGERADNKGTQLANDSATNTVWTMNTTTKYFTGKVVISSLNMNMNTGETVSYDVTFDGCSSLESETVSD